jgi:hypothetical protein
MTNCNPNLLISLRLWRGPAFPNRLGPTRPGVQADQARRGGWGRERSVTDRPGPTLPDFDLIETRSHLPAQTLIVSSCIGNYPICLSGALIPFCVCVFAATKKSASVWLRCQRSHRIVKGHFLKGVSQSMMGFWGVGEGERPNRAFRVAGVA